eukprot:270095-Alexandrium_andersonii.AAC.1
MRYIDDRLGPRLIQLTYMDDRTAAADTSGTADEAFECWSDLELNSGTQNNRAKTQKWGRTERAHRQLS